LEELDRVAGPELDDRLLPALLRALDHPAALRLRLHLDDVHSRDLDVEELLDGLANLSAVRVVVHAERVLADGRAGIALLGDDRGEQDLRGVHQRALPSTIGSAASVTSSERAQTTAPISSSDGCTTATRSRLRKLLARPASSSVQTSTIGRVSSPTIASACFVDGESNCDASTTASVPLPAWLASAERKAALTTLRLTFCSKLRGAFAKAWPPPSNC